LRNFALSNGECLEGGCARKTVSPCQWTSSTGTQTVSDVGWAVAGFQSSPGAGGAGLSLHAPTFLSLITVSGHAPQCSGNSIPHPGMGPSAHQNNPRCGLPVTADEGPYTPAVEHQSCRCWWCWAGQSAASSASLRPRHFADQVKDQAKTYKSLSPAAACVSSISPDGSEIFVLGIYTCNCTSFLFVGSQHLAASRTLVS
jgi:hypothetical protein